MQFSTSIFIILLLCSISGGLFGQVPSNNAATEKKNKTDILVPQTDESQLPVYDTLPMRAYQEFSQQIMALSKKRNSPEKNIKQIVELAEELVAEYPCAYFPGTLLDETSTPISLKKQNDLMFDLTASAEQKAAKAANRAFVFSSREKICLLEYYRYTHFTTPLSRALPYLVLVTNVTHTQSAVRNHLGIASSCATMDLYRLHATLPTVIGLINP